MKVSYNKKKALISLILGIVWTLIGITSIAADSENNFLSGFLIIGIAYLAIYFIQRNIPYVLITDEFIQVCNITKRKIYLKDVLEVKYFAGDYTIKSAAKELSIDTNFVEKESLPNLKKAIEELKAGN